MAKKETKKEAYERRRQLEPAKFANVMTGSYEPTDIEDWKKADIEAKIEPVQPADSGIRKIPEGMNRYNSSQDYLILILESLYRIEAKLGA